jgi:hypothetical protein
MGADGCRWMPMGADIACLGLDGFGDGPPDKPSPCKGASRECLQERAGTRHVSQLASFTRGSYSLSGNATPLQTMQFEVCTPSNYSASSAAGSSQGTRRVRSWGHTSGDRSRVKRDTCVAIGHPSSNLGRNLFPCGVFLSSTESAGSMAQRDDRHSLGVGCTPPCIAVHGAVVRCIQAPR